MKKTNSGHRGVYKRNENRYEAGLNLKRQKSGKSMSFHIGNYPTAEAASLARIKFIDSLKY